MECCSSKTRVLWPVALSLIVAIAALVVSATAQAEAIYSCTSTAHGVSVEIRPLTGAAMPYEAVLVRPGKSNSHWRVRPLVLDSKVIYTTDIGYSSKRDAFQLDLGDIAGKSVPNTIAANLRLHYDEYNGSDPNRNQWEEKLEDIAVTCRSSNPPRFENSCNDVSQKQATSGLVQAAIDGDVEGVEKAFACGADVNATNRIGCTPLMLAIEINRRDCSKQTLPTDSLRHSKGEYIFGFLLDKGAYAFPAEKQRGHTVVHKLVLNGEPELLKTLIALEEDINVQDKSGSTPLMLAAESGGERVIKALVEGGADLALTDLGGKTAYDRGTRLSEDLRNLLIPASTELIVEGAANGTCSPLVLEAKRGENVKLTLKATGQMFMLTLPQGGVSLMASAGESASKTFKIDKLGVFSFECGVHGGKQNVGKLTVK